MTVSPVVILSDIDIDVIIFLVMVSSVVMLSDNVRINLESRLSSVIILSDNP